jgi:hypothetical protein
MPDALCFFSTISRDYAYRFKDLQLVKWSGKRSIDGRARRLDRKLKAMVSEVWLLAFQRAHHQVELGLPVGQG